MGQPHLSQQEVNLCCDGRCLKWASQERVDEMVFRDVIETSRRNLEERSYNAYLEESGFGSGRIGVQDSCFLL